MHFGIIGDQDFKSGMARSAGVVEKRHGSFLQLLASSTIDLAGSLQNRAFGGRKACLPMGGHLRQHRVQLSLKMLVRLGGPRRDRGLC